MSRRHVLVITLHAVVLALGYWGYETYSRRPAKPPSKPTGAPPGVNVIRFTEFTLCEPLPPLGVPVLTTASRSVVLPDEEWRQVELVGQSNREYLERTLATLRQFAVLNREGGGWKDCFLRKEHPGPLWNSTIAYSALKSALPSGLEAEALYLRGDRKTREVQGGFALWIAGAGVLYGHRQGELLGSLAVAVDRSRGIDPRALDGLAVFAQEKGLLLVDWRRGVLLQPDDPRAVQHWLASWR